MVSAGHPALAALMRRAGIEEADLKERFARAQGPGGQKVNKTSSAVLLRHGPSGLSVKVQTSRSQAVNRLLARQRLAAALLLRELQGQQAERQRIAKIQRQKARRHRRAQAKVLADKHHTAARKRARARPDPGAD